VSFSSRAKVVFPVVLPKRLANPGFAEAAREESILPPTKTSPFRLPWNPPSVNEVPTKFPKNRRENDRTTPNASGGKEVFRVGYRRCFVPGRTQSGKSKGNWHKMETGYRFAQSPTRGAKGETDKTANNDGAEWRSFFPFCRRQKVRGTRHKRGQPAFSPLYVIPRKWQSSCFILDSCLRRNDTGPPDPASLNGSAGLCRQGSGRCFIRLK